MIFEADFVRGIARRTELSEPEPMLTARISIRKSNSFQLPDLLGIFFTFVVCGGFLVGGLPVDGLSGDGLPFAGDPIASSAPGAPGAFEATGASEHETGPGLSESRRPFVETYFAESYFAGLDEYRLPAKTAVLDMIPHVKQLGGFGGEACVEMGLRGQGIEVSQSRIFNISAVDPVHGRGCHRTELQSAVARLGIETGPGTVEGMAGAHPAILAAQQCVREIDSGRPVIVATRQRLDSSEIVERFLLVVGYDGRRQAIVVHDPVSKAGKFRVLDLVSFLRSMTMIAEPEPRTLPATTVAPAERELFAFCLALRCPNHLKWGAWQQEEGFTSADYAQHVRRLKQRLPDESFNIVLQEPFVVVGDERASVVARRAKNTVQWAVEKLKKQYFSKDPDRILDIWLFKDEKSYYSHAEQLWGSRPNTIYGYYSSQHGALVMNISTGGGTLVHEIVHPFIEANFPECPSWFNEGLASLYEQSFSKDGEIFGATNWRLRGLQAAIKEGNIPSFEKLMSTTRREFYEDGRGINYAQARYLCFYLQEKGKLNQYYHQFVANIEDDPTGLATLRSVLEREDLDAFQTEWERFVMQLRF